MIRINLNGAAKKKKSSGGKGLTLNFAMPKTVTPILLVLIVVGAAVGGYVWYKGKTDESLALDSRISGLEQRKAALDKFIKENQVYESRKKTLENRIKVVESLQRNQVNPVLALDVLSEAIEKTKFVWLSTLEQNNAILNMSGTGTSLDAISDFYHNLDNTGYFKHIELKNATDSSGNFTFSLTCEFSPPVPATAAPAAGGGN